MQVLLSCRGDVFGSPGNTNGGLKYADATGRHIEGSGTFYIVDPNIGIGLIDPRYQLEIRDSSGASGGSADAGGDNFVIDGSGNVGMTIQCRSLDTGVINFGDDTVTNSGQIKYLHPTDDMEIWAGSWEALTFHGQANTSEFYGPVGIGTPPDPGAQLHISGGGAIKEYTALTSSVNVTNWNIADNVDFAYGNLTESTTLNLPTAAGITAGRVQAGEITGNSGANGVTLASGWETADGLAPVIISGDGQFTLYYRVWHDGTVVRYRMSVIKGWSAVP